MSLFEQATAISDPPSGLTGFLVIHNASRGPATGGIRLYSYSSEEEALADGIRLARAMTFKAIAAELPVGGGKIVLMKPPETTRNDALRALGRFINGLGGRFLAGRDIGLPVEDGAIIRGETSYMIDESNDNGVGDLNLATARGVLAGARAALSFHLDRTDFKGVRVALQGAGGVGAWLARKLDEEGAELFVCDTRQEALDALGQSISFHTVAVNDIYSVECDLFAPCAIGGVLDESSAAQLTARIVVGSANNILANISIGDSLAERGIVFVPDFLVNAGALIQGVRFLLHGEQQSLPAIEAIGSKTFELLERAKSAGLCPARLLEQELSSQFDPRGDVPL